MAMQVDYMRVLVCGGREFNDYDRVVVALASHVYYEATLIHGDCRGADRLAAEVWKGWGRPVESHPADWARYGRSAGFRRNEEMLQSGVDLVIAFPGGKGTAHMVNLALRAGIEVVMA